MKKVFHLFFCPLFVLAAMVVFTCWGNRELIGVAEAARPGPLTCGRVECPLPGPCQVREWETCVRGGGQPRCPALVNAAEGTMCSDGNACSQVDTCQSGVCTGESYVECPASDECHDGGTCDPATGVCSDPAQPDGTVCSDGSACTQSDACQAGACVGGAPVVCTASDQCHTAGTCDPATGTCSNPTVPDGNACDDGDACTTYDLACTNNCDFCSSGICQPGTIDKTLCFAAGCPDGYSGPGVLDPTISSCTTVDGDKDGLTSAWENAGWVDMDCNGGGPGPGDFVLPVSLYDDLPTGTDRDARMDILVELHHLQGETAPQYTQCLQWHTETIDWCALYCGTPGDPSGCGYTDEAQFAADFGVPGCVEVRPTPQCEVQGPAINAITSLKNMYAMRGKNLYIEEFSDLTVTQPVHLPRHPGDLNKCNDPTQNQGIDIGAVDFYDIKQFSDPARQPFFHWFGAFNKVCVDPQGERPGVGLAEFATGVGEQGGLDGALGLLSWKSDHSSDGFDLGEQVAYERMFEGTFAHELGHNLGLCHNGHVSSSFDWTSGLDPCDGMDEYFAPNAISVMNYNYQLLLIDQYDPAGVPVPDYTDGTQDVLDTAALNETTGNGAISYLYKTRYFSGECNDNLSPVESTVPGQVDWDCDGTYETSTTAQLGGIDPNTGSPYHQVGYVYPTYDQWANLNNQAMCLPTISDGVTLKPPEISLNTMTSLGRGPALLSALEEKVIVEGDPLVRLHDSLPLSRPVIDGRPPLVPSKGWISVAVRSRGSWLAPERIDDVDLNGAALLRERGSLGRFVGGRQRSRRGPDRGQQFGSSHAADEGRRHDRRESADRGDATNDPGGD